MKYDKLKNIRLEIEFMDGKKLSCDISPRSMQELLAYHDISALHTTFDKLLEMYDGDKLTQKI